METKDHLMLAKRIGDSSKWDLKYTHKLAFIWGNIWPDINLLTYPVLGNSRYLHVKGHNYEYASKRVDKMIEELGETKHIGIHQYYLMGVILHYVADCFTFPHNKEFSGTMKAHICYEHELHKVLSSQTESHNGRTNSVNKGFDITKNLYALHEDYINFGIGCRVDQKYINTAAELTVGYFRTLIRKYCISGNAVPHLLSNE